MTWKQTGREVVYKSPWVTATRNSFLLPDGAEIADYFMVERPGFVLIVAERDEALVLVRQFRPATSKTYLSLPGGYLEDGENITAAAIREFREETGCGLRETTIIARMDPLPGYVRSAAHVAYGLAGDRTDEVDGEVEEVCVVPWNKVLEWTRDGTICEMQSVAAILLTQAHKVHLGN